MQTVDIYIDTSIKGPKRRNGSYLYIIAFTTSAGTADTGIKVDMENTTENQATLYALEAALKRLNKPCKITFYLECPHVFGTLRERWFEYWKENGWRTKKGTQVSDVDKWQSIEYLLDKHEYNVRFHAAHSYREWMQRELREER